MSLSSITNALTAQVPASARIAAIVAFTLLCCGLLWLHDHDVKQAAVREYKLEAALSVDDSTLSATRKQLTLAQAAARKRDTVYVVAKAAYQSKVATFDTLSAHLDVTDTASVRVTVASADTAIRACSVVVQTCEQRVADRDTQISLLTNENKTLVDEVRLAKSQAAVRVCSIPQKAQSFGTGAAVGALAALLLHR